MRRWIITILATQLLALSVLFIGSAMSASPDGRTSASTSGIAPVDRGAVNKPMKMDQIPGMNGTLSSHGFATLSAALTAAEATGKILLLNTNLNLTANITTSVPIIVLPGIGRITQTAAYFLNLAGGFTSDPREVFVGFAPGQITGLKEVLPEFWGGKADNFTDSTNAFILAFAAVNSSSESSTGLGTLFTSPKFRTQKGKYKITGTVTFPYVLIWEGSDTQIIISAGVKAFATPNGVSVLRIDGVQFWGGQTALEYDPTSTDLRMVEIENCVFQEQTAYALKTTSTAVVNGFNLRVRKSKFLNTSGNTSYVAIQNMSDIGLIEDCWFCNFARYEIENYGNLTVRGITNVPMAAGMTLVKNYGSYLNVTENRLGNESGGVTVVEQRASGVWDYHSNQYSLSIEKNIVYQSSVPLVKFYALPNQVIIRGNAGTNYQSSLYFDSTIPAKDVKHFSSSNYHNYENVTPLIMLTGDSTKYGAFLAGLPAKTLSVGSLISTWLAREASVGSKACSSSGYTDLFGRTGYKYTSTGSGSHVYWRWPKALTSCTSGRQYTVSAGVDVLDSQAADVTIQASGQITRVSVGMGYHQLNFPIRYDSSDPVVYLQLTNFTGTVAVTAVRILAGDVAPSSQDLVFLGSALPSKGTWLIGDRIMRLPPVAGQPKGWMCTVTGSYSDKPPTWVSEGNL